MNYKQIYAMKATREKRIIDNCSDITNDSGIYVFYRTDENEIKHCYCGQARHLLERTASHLAEYDHIGLSLKKRGFYSDDNIYGWKLIFKTCSLDMLDANEKLTIKTYADRGYQLYNVTAGGQGQGKTQLKDYKPAKTYRDGIKQGRKNLAKELLHIIDTHLVISLKPEKQGNKVSENAMQKFYDLLNDKE